MRQFLEIIYKLQNDDFGIIIFKRKKIIFFLYITFAFLVFLKGIEQIVVKKSLKFNNLPIVTASR